MSFARLLAAKRAMTPGPGEGYNLVGVYAHEPEPADALYFIANYATEAEAEAAVASRKQLHPDEVVYIYGPDPE